MKTPLIATQETIAEFDAIVACIKKQSNKARLDIAQIAKKLVLPITTVKNTFYALLATRKIKASFIPYCVICGSKLGNQNISAYIIRYRAENGDYVCPKCNKVVCSDDVEIEMIFWRLGAKAIRGGDWKPPLISEKGKNR